MRGLAAEDSTFLPRDADLKLTTAGKQCVNFHADDYFGSWKWWKENPGDAVFIASVSVAAYGVGLLVSPIMIRIEWEKE